MKASLIKQFFKQKYNIPVRVENSKHFVGIRIVPEKEVSIYEPLKYKYEFPLEMRQKMLSIIYGPKDWTASGNAGNIRPHSLALSHAEWEKFYSENA